MRKLIIPLIFLSLLSFAVYAEEGIDIKIVPIQSSVMQGETATYTIIITNSLSTNEDFMIRTAELDWTLDTPDGNYFYTVYQQTTKKINISLSQRVELPPGFYGLSIMVERFKTGAISKEFLDVNIKSGKPREFLPSIRTTLTLPYEVDPKNDLHVFAEVENLNPRVIDKMTLTLEGDNFTEYKDINLGSNERKTEEFVIKQNPYSKPGIRVVKLHATTFALNKTFTFDAVKEYKIMDYATLRQTTQVDAYFMKTVETITATNEGNTERDFEIRRPIGFFKGMFTSVEPAADTLKTTEATYMLWHLSVAPQESTNIVVTTNYRPITIFLLLLLLIIMAYYIIRSPIIIKKSIAQIHTTSEGGISEMKVVLHLKSRSKCVVDDIKVIDKIPFLVEINKEFHVGTLKPTTISKTTEEGSIVRWDVTNLEPFEERIITYRIKTKLSILGGIKLPATVVKYKNRKNKEVKTHSNSVNLEI